MDISKIYDTLQGQPSSPKKVDTGNRFKQVFDKKLNEINATIKTPPIGSRSDVIEQGDKILNLLDDYSRGLADPTKTLKDIGPLVQSIEKEVSLIKTEASEKIHNDKELEKFIKDLAVTANVALFKFHRGDYI
jgi:hypothetical protein